MVNPGADLHELDRLARSSFVAILGRPGALALIQAARDRIDLESQAVDPLAGIDQLQLTVLATMLAGGELWTGPDGVELPNAFVVPGVELAALVELWPILLKRMARVGQTAAALGMDTHWGGGLVALAQLILLPIDLGRTAPEIVDDLNISATWSMDRGGRVTDSWHTSTPELTIARRIAKPLRPTLQRPKPGGKGHGSPSAGKYVRVVAGMRAALAIDPHLTIKRLILGWDLDLPAAVAFRKAAQWRKRKRKPAGAPMTGTDWPDRRTLSKALAQVKAKGD